MLEDNYKIEGERGEYKDFPFRYTLYLYGTAVWVDDFHLPRSEKQVVEAFIKDLEEAVGIERKEN